MTEYGKFRRVMVTPQFRAHRSTLFSVEVFNKKTATHPFKGGDQKSIDLHKNIYH